MAEKTLEEDKIYFNLNTSNEKLNKSLSSFKDKFDAEGMEGSINEIDGLFDEFQTISDEVNTLMEDNVGTSPTNGDESAIMGEYGEKVYGLYDVNKVAFDDFGEHFSNYTAALNDISNKEQDFSEESGRVYGDENFIN